MIKPPYETCRLILADRRKGKFYLLHDSDYYYISRYSLTQVSDIVFDKFNRHNYSGHKHSSMGTLLNKRGLTVGPWHDYSD